MRRWSFVRLALVSTLTAGLFGVAVPAGASAAVVTPAVAAPAAAAAPVVSPAAAPAGKLTTITPGLKGFDNITVETPTQIACMSAAGYTFDVVNINPTGWQDEYNAAAAAGMKVALFQGYYAPYWSDNSKATFRGNAMVAAAKAVGYPAKGQVFLNVENNIQSGVTAESMLSWINTWAAIVRAGGYQPGVYIGVPQILTAAQVNSLSNIVFWRSASSSAPQTSHGYVFRQPSTSQTACGIGNGGIQGIDIDIAGTDASGRHLVGAAFPKTLPTSGVAGSFGPLTPARLLDTRKALGASGPVGATKSVDLQVTGRGGVPAGATAVVLNVTVTVPTLGGYITVYPTGGVRPTVSTLDFSAHQTIANLATVQLSAAGKVTMFNGSSGTVQLIADVAGYYRGGGTGTQPGTFVPVYPKRLLDTRPAGVAKTSTTNVTLANKASIPLTGFDAAVLNVTAVSPAALGYITAYPAGSARPTASNIDFAAGQTIPNMVTVGKASTSAAATVAVSLFNGSTGKNNLLADVAGYYKSGTRVDSGAFTPLTPARILDSRKNIGNVGKIAASSAISLVVAGRGGVPVGSTAVVLNVTVVGQTKGGYLTVFPSDQSAPVASNIDFVAGQTIANQVIVPIGADGRVVLYNVSGGTTDLLADVAGYFRA